MIFNNSKFRHYFQYFTKHNYLVSIFNFFNDLFTYSLRTLMRQAANNLLSNTAVWFRDRLNKQLRSIFKIYKT